ncbi:MAG TPA: superoxide dismutase family protein [Chloroflexota bacterium]|nr:superoxide dismutase family protein [Chloroflexota bacterium]
MSRTVCSSRRIPWRQWGLSVALGAALVSLSGLAAAEAPAAAELAQQPGARAELRDSTGAVVGTATFTEDATGVHISVVVQGLPPGEHGIHLHAVGRCDPPDFMSAGGHYNPGGRLHGLMNLQGPHEGDLPNLFVGADGTATYQVYNPRVTLQVGAANSLFTADGTALVIHADPDDYITDPAGNSGARIACGVIVRE